MEEKFICPHDSCGKSYVNNTILKRHIQAVHDLQKRFQCSVCGKCLSSQQNLKEHGYIHTGEKPYVCQYPGCNFASRQGTHLSAHKKIHSCTFARIDTGFDRILNYLTSVLGKEEQFSYCEEVTEKVELPLLKDQNI